MIARVMDRDQAKSDLNCFLTSLSGTPLTSRQIAGYRRKDAVAGWRLEIDFDDRKRRIDFLIDQGFPFTPPVLVLVDHPPALRWPPNIVWPHLEKDNKLCLLPSSSPIAYHDPVAVAKNLLASACQLIEDCVSGINKDDFISEFNSYWQLIVSNDATEFRSLVNLEPPCRIIQVWCGKGFYILSDNESTGSLWLQNLFQDNKERKSEFLPAVFLWLDRALLPQDYPRNASDVLQIAAQRTHGGETLLKSLTEKGPERIVVLFSALSKNGPCLAGVTIHRPETLKSRSGHLLLPGFRPGKVPVNNFARHYFSGFRVKHSIVSRVDASWVHGRDSDGRQSKLQKSKIAVLGCGSVGGAVAMKLAQAGVGQMLLIDPDVLSWPNIGRHPLGASQVYELKAKTLASNIKKDYPHATSIDGYDVSWQDLVKSDPTLLKSCDLIISTIASGNAEDELNQWHLKNERTPAIVYGWTEAHACAGHAVAILPGGGCFQCGQTDPIKSMFRVTQWPEGEEPNQEPACGAIYQPYGPVELTYIEALITEMVLDYLFKQITQPLHRLWIGRDSLLKSIGGVWNSDWKSSTKGPLSGGFTEDRPWPSNTECRDCKGQ